MEQNSSQELNSENIVGKTVSEGIDPVTGKFLPGNKLGGNKKGSRWLSKMLEDALFDVDSDDPQKRTDAQIIIDKVKQKAKRGDLRAIEHIWDRSEGKAPQAIDITSKGEQITTLTSEERVKLDNLLNGTK